MLETQGVSPVLLPHTFSGVAKRLVYPPYPAVREVSEGPATFIK
jgi:hypothetical protein